MFKRYIFPALILSLSLGFSVYFQFSALAFISANIAALTLAALFSYRFSAETTIPASNPQSNDNKDQSQFTNEPQKTFTPTFQQNKTPVEIFAHDLSTVEGLYKIVCNTIENGLPSHFKKGLTGFPITMAILALGALKKCAYGYSLMAVKEFHSGYQRANKLHASGLVYSLEMQNFRTLLRPILASIQKLPSAQRPPRVVIPIGCTTGVPHVVTGVIDFDTNGSVSCFIYDPISPYGYREAKDIFITMIKQEFKLEYLKVVEPNLRMEKYDMTKCAVWCYAFQEFLVSIPVSYPLEKLGEAFKNYVQPRYESLCKEKGISANTDPATAEIQFTNLLYDRMKQLINELKVALEEELSFHATPKTTTCKAR